MLCFNRFIILADKSTTTVPNVNSTGSNILKRKGLPNRTPSHLDCDESYSVWGESKKKVGLNLKDDLQYLFILHTVHLCICNIFFCLVENNLS